MRKQARPTGEEILAFLFWQLRWSNCDGFTEGKERFCSYNSDGLLEGQGQGKAQGKGKGL